MPTNDSIRKINTNNGTTGNCYLTNADSITVGSQTYPVANGFDFANFSQDVQEAAKYKKTFEVADPPMSIPFVGLDGTITLIEKYNEAHRYAYGATHSYTGEEGTSHTLSLPKRLVKWNYYFNNTLVEVPSTFTQQFAERFVDGNLDVYAEWSDDIKAIRVIPYVVSASMTTPMTPSCTVAISSGSYTGNSPLSSNYSKMLHRKTSANEDITWAICKQDIGSNTASGSLGNGCQMADPDYNDNIVPCYYGIKSGDSIEITFSGLNGTYNGRTYSNAYKPYQGLTSNPQYKPKDFLSAQIDTDPTGYQNYASSQGGAYTITQSNITTDKTYFLPLILNTFAITVRCEDASSSTPSAKGYVDVESLNYNENPTDYEIRANCVNNEDVTISVTSTKPGYIFSHWEDGNGVTLQYPQTFTLQQINSSVNGNVYVACFTTGQFTLTYHKEAV